MKKSLLAIGLLATSVCAHATSNTFYAENAVSVLKSKGYTQVRITDQVQGYCTIAKSDFDWSAASFKAVNKKGHEVNGVVCANRVYLKNKE